MKLTSHSPEETQRFGKELGHLARAGDVILLVGNLGAGKTCLTQGIAWGLDIDGYARSPSFVVVNEYKGRLPMYHIDLYRLDNIAEIADLGLDDYLYGHGLCVVEWADKALDLMPPQNLLIKIDLLSENERRLELKSNGERYKAIIADVKKRFK
ncbi:MAG: tRNA (adenosine(37)-N6)-threonylcarbamoyltransferase complex ATPase subunit type 1 TsaE [Dehalococcoidia bacterium]|jgi:tRNA threonylcarbamoyladenosine biosynthesis protein TsaE